MNPNPCHPSSAGPDLEPRFNMADSEGALGPLSEVCGQATLDSLQDLGQSGHHPTWDVSFSLSTPRSLVSLHNPSILPLLPYHTPRPIPAKLSPPYILPTPNTFPDNKDLSINNRLLTNYSPLDKRITSESTHTRHGEYFMAIKHPMFFTLDNMVSLHFFSDSCLLANKGYI